MTKELPANKFPLMGPENANMYFWIRGGGSIERWHAWSRLTVVPLSQDMPVDVSYIFENSELLQR